MKHLLRGVEQRSGQLELHLNCYAFFAYARFRRSTRETSLMAWWGAVLGGVFGAMAFGPIGAILGAVVGSKVTKSKQRLLGQDADGFDSVQERRQTAFFVATFTVMGHIAKSDGHVSQQEIDYVKTVMSHMSLDQDQRKIAKDLFNQGKQPDFPLRDVVNQFYSECKRSENLLRSYLAIQISAARADGRISVAENEALQNVASMLGFDEAEFRAMFESEQGAYAGSASSSQRSLDSDYKMLEIGSDADDDEVRRAYRRMMSRYHPDKLVSKGLPEEMIDFATEKTKEIRAAYERIRDARRPTTVH